MKRYRRLARLLWRSKESREQEAREEIEAHIEMRVEDLKRSGMSEEEARREARARFGDLDEARRRMARAARRRDRRLGWAERAGDATRDVRLALRRMRAQPGHTLLTVGIFGLGIGLTTVMFTFVDNVLLRPLPFPEPDRLVALFSVPEEGGAFPWVSQGNWYDWEQQNRTLQSSAIHSQEPRDVTVATDDGAHTVPGVTVLGDFFGTLGLPFITGRGPAADDVRDDPHLVVVSEGFWRDQLGATPLSSGVTVVLDGATHTVVGVVARGFEHPEGIDIWLPRAPRPQTGGMRNNINFLAVARLQDGISLDQAEADLSAIARGIRASEPEAIYSYGVGVRPFDDVVVSSAKDYLATLMGAVILVLLVGCANLAALGFARGSARSGELAVRLSLGAGRSRVVRQLVTEEMLLAFTGGALGLVLAWWGSGALLEHVADVLPRSRDVGFDGRIAAFGIAASILSGLAAGLPPALRAARRNGGQALVGTRAIEGRGGLPGALMVAGEVAMTVLLLTGGGLLLMSFGAVASRDLGFDPRGVVTADVALVAPRYRTDPEERIRYWESLLETVGELPDVASVGAGLWIPTGGSGTGFIDLDGRPELGQGAGYRVVGGDYFESLRIPLLQGRTFDDRDRLDTGPVTVINQAMADQYWSGIDPIGQRVRAVSMESYGFEDGPPWRTIVGVVGTVRHYGFESEGRAEMFVPFRQNPWMAGAVAAVARTRDGEAGPALSSVREAVRSLDASLAVEVSTLEGRLDRLLAERRMIVGVLGVFAITALLLASLGIYGVISHAVARRSREMAIRAALGARRSGLVRLVLAGALRLVAVGAVVGIAMAFGFRGVLDSLLVDVDSGDPRAYALAGLCLALVATAAALIPARRAAMLDPLEALRDGG